MGGAARSGAACLESISERSGVVEEESRLSSERNSIAGTHLDTRCLLHTADRTKFSSVSNDS